MFIEHKKKDEIRTLRKDFLNTLDIELKKGQYKQDEAKLRGLLKNQFEKGLI